MKSTVRSLELPDVGLQTGYMTGLDLLPRLPAVRRRGELCLGNVEFVLQATHHGSDLREIRRQLDRDETEVRTELIVRAVGAEPKGVLPYARATGETGRSMVARTGIETRDALASGRPGSSSSGELSPWTGQNEM